jgi:hypothetical protein
MFEVVTWVNVRGLIFNVTMFQNLMFEVSYLLVIITILSKLTTNHFSPNFSLLTSAFQLFQKQLIQRHNSIILLIFSSIGRCASIQ